MKSKSASRQIPTTPHPHSVGDFEALLRVSMDEVLIKTNAQRDAWGLGDEEQWFLDHGSGELIFTFADAVSSAPAQVIGTFDLQTCTWTWAWADPSLPDHLKNDSWQVREFGASNGFQHLVTSSWTAEESHCWYMTALACHLCHCQGAFRGVSHDKYVFITFGDVTTMEVNEPMSELDCQELMEQTAAEFKACIDNPDEQRQVCVYYLSRGSLARLPQDQLIHRLGLTAPSVLDLAGYSSDQAESVMAMLKSISDEEIAAAEGYDCGEQA